MTVRKHKFSLAPLGSFTPILFIIDIQTITWSYNLKTRALMNRLVILAVLATFETSFLSSTHGAPVELDGTISAVKTNKDGTVALTIMGVSVNVPKDVSITSPSAVLTLAQLADPAPLPGRTQAGFVGGNAFVTGDTDPNTGVITASDIFVEPANNLLLGVVTSKGGGPLKVNHMAVELSTDTRMPCAPPKNKYGMPVDIKNLASGTPILIEGYYDGGSFRAFNLEIRGKSTVASPNPQIAIIASKCWERSPNTSLGDEVEIRGAVTMTHAPAEVNTQIIRVFRIDNGVDTMLGDAIAKRDTEDPNYALFDFKVATPPSGDAVLGTAPTRFRVVNISAAMTESDVTDLVKDMPLTSR